MNLSTLSQWITKSAPLLGSVLAGPAGSAIGTLVATQFGGDIQQPEALLQQLQQDPEAAQKLLRLQSEHAVELQRLQLLMAENELKYALLNKEQDVQDKTNARARELSLVQASQRDYTPAILAYLLTLGVFCALYYLFSHDIPVANKELIVGMMSALATVWVSAMGYYHGSSAGSRQKDALLLQPDRRALPGASPNAASL